MDHFDVDLQQPRCGAVCIRFSEAVERPQTARSLCQGLHRYPEPPRLDGACQCEPGEIATTQAVQLGIEFDDDIDGPTAAVARGKHSRDASLDLSLAHHDAGGAPLADRSKGLSGDADASLGPRPLEELKDRDSGADDATRIDVSIADDRIERTPKRGLCDVDVDQGDSRVGSVKRSSRGGA
jgi:hypothetical protein